MSLMDAGYTTFTPGAGVAIFTVEQVLGISALAVIQRGKLPSRAAYCPSDELQFCGVGQTVCRRC